MIRQVTEAEVRAWAEGWVKLDIVGIEFAKTYDRWYRHVLPPLYYPYTWVGVNLTDETLRLEEYHQGDVLTIALPLAYLWMSPDAWQAEETARLADKIAQHEATQRALARAERDEYARLHAKYGGAP